jgi:N-acetylglucosaminyldiphosphoundecaprenol N-acetyl-beta-D-mannosaminyltransferase
MNAEQTPQVDLFGVPVAALTMEQAVATAERVIEQRSHLLISVVNASKLVQMRHDSALRQAVLAADLILADGMSVVWAARLLGRPLPERIAGIDLMTRLLEGAGRQRYRVFYLGATDEVLAEVAQQVQRDYPNAVIAGQHNGYFSDDRDEQIAAAIAAAQPDILFAAMGTPKKEQFLARWAPYMGVPVCHGVGGGFDVLAGKVRRAPALWQRSGFEWLYRVFQEPRRLWRRYLVANPIFAYMVVRAVLAGGVRAQRKDSPREHQE